jgi:Ca2+-binding EF-hand superfamily protein
LSHGLLTVAVLQFSLFDLDRDRHLDYHELRVALRALGFQPPKPELVHLLTTHGVPRPQASQRYPQTQSQPPHPSQLLIPHPAFQQLAARKILERDPREEIDRAFDLFDADGKGWINLEDLKRVARELGETGLEEEELRAMIEEFDLEGAGGVGRDAFVGICLQ